MIEVKQKGPYTIADHIRGMGDTHDLATFLADTFLYGIDMINGPQKMKKWLERDASSLTEHDAASLLKYDLRNDMEGMEEKR